MVGKDPTLAMTQLTITRQAEFGHVSTEVKIFPTYINYSFMSGLLCLNIIYMF